jgi:hypothetical protein
MSTIGRYMFAVATGLESPDLEGHDGLDGNPLSVVEHHGLQAVVCDVDLDEFGEEPVRRNLEQLAWVEKVARTHDSVVRAVAARATVAPLRLITVCLDDESVVRRLDQWEEPLRSALERVEGCREWSVKAYVGATTDATTDAATNAAGDGDDDSVPTGTAYLQRKREQSGRRQQADRELAETAEALHVALAGRSKASRVLAPQDPQLTGRSDRMILNGAYLVARRDESAFQATVDDLVRRHPDASLEVAGPWAPYSFAVLEVSHDG